jgi:hypothetical protein
MNEVGRLSTSPISKLRAAFDERRQGKRNSLADKLTVEAKALADLEGKKAKIDGERRVEADLGPVRYLATLLGASDEGVLRWFILAVALLLDPAAAAKHGHSGTVATNRYRNCRSAVADNAPGGDRCL